MRMAGIEIAQNGAVLFPPDWVAFDYFVEEAVGIEVLQGEVAVKHFGSLELGDDGKHVAGKPLETFVEFTRKPVFAQDVSIDVA